MLRPLTSLNIILSTRNAQSDQSRIQKEAS